MIIAMSIEFLLVTLISAKNITDFICMIYEKKIIRRVKIAFAALLPLSLALSSAMLLNLDAAVHSVAFFAYYAAYIAVPILLGSRRDIPRFMFATLFYLFFDSLVQSLAFAVLSNFIAYKYEYLLTWTVSLIYAAAVQTVLRKTAKKDLTLLKSSLFSVPKSVYLLTLATLLLMGGLLDNQFSDTDNVLLQNAVTKFLTVLCITTVTVIIITLIINSVSKTYYENISKLLEEQISSQLTYYENLDKFNSELRSFRHDYKNHMLCIQTLAEEKQYDDLIDYVRQITNREISDFQQFYTGNKIADIILSDKQKAALSIGARIEFSGEITDKLPAKDICGILANGVDNAIEACRKIEDDIELCIKVSCTYAQNMQVIEISNPVLQTVEIKNNSVPTSKTDKDTHGFGLYNIKRAVSKYNGDFEIRSENNMFYLEIGFLIV